MDEYISFWQRVEYLLDSKGLTKKELAKNTHITPSNISKGLQNKSSPSAQTAVEIAQFLDTTVEYLVTGQDRKYFGKNKEELDTLYKYSHTVKALDSIPEDPRKSIQSMIFSISEANTEKDIFVN